MIFGVIRPGWDVEGEADAPAADGHCFYSTFSGTREPGPSDWEGKQGAMKQGDRIGMLLDLDQGSMTVWKNDEKLGLMQAEGLRGPFCWAVSMYHQGYSARIESMPAFASPTEEELAAAKAWERRDWLRLPPTATDAECEAAEATYKAAVAAQRRDKLGLPLTATDAECDAAEAEHYTGS